MLKKKPVNKESAELNTFGGRIVSERKKLGLSQIDLLTRTGVSKSTQIKYEAGTSYPDAEYLMKLDIIGLDVMYILTGLKTYEATTDEEQNLLEAYADAPETLKRAAFAVLLSPYLEKVTKIREIPGYHRHELKGEEDTRYVEHHQAELNKEK